MGKGVFEQLVYIRELFTYTVYVVYVVFVVCSTNVPSFSQ
jgi:hypothetical protein